MVTLKSLTHPPTLLKYFFGVPHLDSCVFLTFYNEPELGAEIDPGMALTPLPSSIGPGLNPQPSERSALPLDHRTPTHPLHIP